MPLLMAASIKRLRQTDCLGRRLYRWPAGSGQRVQPRARIVFVTKQCATNVAGVYAIGDLVRGPMLAHKVQKRA